MKKKIINIDPETLGGTPVFYGTRVPIKNLFDYLSGGESIDEFLEDFPSVQNWQVIEIMIQKAKFKPGLAKELADQIEYDWWAENGEEFLKDVVR